MNILALARQNVLTTACLCIALCFFGYFSVTAFYGKGIFDFPIFVDVALDFEKTGVIYDRDSDYSPNLAVYKFPPLLAAILVGAHKLGVSRSGFFDIAYYLHISLYFLSVLILSIWAYTKQRRGNLLLMLFSFGLMWYPLLDTNIIRLQLDVYILFLLVVAFIFFEKSYFFTSGFIIALAFCLKIYPVLLIGLLVSVDWKRSSLGFFLGLVCACIFTVCVLGIDENLFFTQKIFPKLLGELPAGGGGWKHFSANNFRYFLAYSSICAFSHRHCIARTIDGTNKIRILRLQ